MNWRFFRYLFSSLGMFHHMMRLFTVLNLPVLPENNSASSMNSFCLDSTWVAAAAENVFVRELSIWKKWNIRLICFRLADNPFSLYWPFEYYTWNFFKFLKLFTTLVADSHLGGGGKEMIRRWCSTIHWRRKGMTRWDWESREIDLVEGAPKFD